jgi:hypothetical protein
MVHRLMSCAPCDVVSLWLTMESHGEPHGEPHDVVSLWLTMESHGEPHGEQCDVVSLWLTMESHGDPCDFVSLWFSFFWLFGEPCGG